MIAAFAQHEPDKLDSLLPLPRPRNAIVVRNGRVVQGELSEFGRAMEALNA